MRRSLTSRARAGAAALCAVSLLVAYPTSGYTADDPVSVASHWPEYPTNPFTFDLNFSFPTSFPAAGRGGIFAHDVTGDGLMEFVVTSVFASGLITVYGHNGGELWFHWPNSDQIHFSELRGANTPGVMAGDTNGNGNTEIIFVTQGGKLNFLRGTDGQLLRSLDVPGSPDSVTLANLRGLGDRDAILQYSRTELRAIRLDTGAELWHTTDWTGADNGIARAVDLDGDGLDDVAGGIILDHTGQRKHGWDLPTDLGTQMDKLDTIVYDDLQLNGYPIEVAIAEQDEQEGLPFHGETIVVNPSQILWHTERPLGDIPPSGQCDREKDPDKLAIGNYSLAAPVGLEVFARSACGNHPWVMNANGQIYATWNVPDTAPAGWYAFGRPCPAGATCADSEGGIDTVTPVLWSWPSADIIAVTERSVRPAKAALVNPNTGNFGLVLNTTGHVQRLYVADVAGDFREEVIVIESITGGNDRVTIFWNGAPNPDPNALPHFWDFQWYARAKQNYNYYSTS